MTGEVQSCRQRLAQFCVGNGADLGFGGSPVNGTAICIDRPEGHPGRAVVPAPVPPTHFAGDVRDLPFRDGVLDYVFSAHCLEDMEDTKATLQEWCRVLKPGGHLVLFLPDQQRYVRYCQEHGEVPNSAHKHGDFGLAYVKARLPAAMLVVHEMAEVPDDPRSFDLVARKG